MMNSRIIPMALLLCTLTAGFGVAQACDKPDAIQVPDGATASTEDMVAGQQAVKKYIADGNAYLSCMEEAEKAELDPPLTDEQKKVNVEFYNSVVDEMQLLAQNFNEQIKAYKASNAEQ